MNDRSVAAVEGKLVEEIAAILCLAVSDVKTDVPLPSLGLDSMGFVELLVVIEATFDIRLIDSDLTREDFENIHALACRISMSHGV